MFDALPDAVLDRVFRTARTANHYLDTPVPEALLRDLWDLMKWGPTSANQMPARIIWCVSQEAKDRLADCASGANAPKIKAAPVTAIIGMDLEFYEKLPKLFPHVDARAWFVGNEPLIRESAFRNSTLQGAYFVVAARLLGLDAGPMSGFNAAAVDEAFFAGASIRTNFIATLGYGDFSNVHPRLERLSFEDATQLR
ncbi:malonic semialdehyde reductase [Sphingomonas nostoxanthinifaciens]|uniref:malonic semialdehyde reductase n=1 Tax=Sphingomonas nostoxanthinifaciens TaxID=2872652 RepID=UPI001CC1FFA8|nr:malonic semialdehyde reductase [Sphingomonas nostoxanthinifaciens]UAK24801.1 malonic semialdehyde reductase [Sphingomonas nostoxanthinifaciens]